MKKLIVLGPISLALSVTLLPVLAATQSIEQIRPTYFVSCTAPHVLNTKTNICEIPYRDMEIPFEIVTIISSCEQPKEFNPISHVCELPLQTLPVLCQTGQFLNASKTACITPQATCRSPHILNQMTNSCEMPARNSKTVCATGKILNAATLACIDPSSQHITLPQS